MGKPLQCLSQSCPPVSVIFCCDCSHVWNNSFYWVIVGYKMTACLLKAWLSVLCWKHRAGCSAAVMSLRQRSAFVYLVGVHFSASAQRCPACLDPARVSKLDVFFPRTLAVFIRFDPEIFSPTLHCPDFASWPVDNTHGCCSWNRSFPWLMSLKCGNELNIKWKSTVLI